MDSDTDAVTRDSQTHVVLSSPSSSPSASSSPSPGVTIPAMWFPHIADAVLSAAMASGSALSLRGVCRSWREAIDETQVWHGRVSSRDGMRRLEGNGRASIHLDASLPSRLRSVDVPWGDEKLVDKFRFRDVGVQVVRVMRDTSKDKEGAPGGVMFESAPKIELLDPSSSDDDRKLTVHLASVPKPAWARDPLDPPVTTCAVPNCTCHNLPASTGMVYVLLPPNHTWSAPEVLTWVWPFVKMRVPVTYVITDGSDWTEEGLPVHPRTAMLTLWDRKAQFGRAEGERLATKLSAEDDDSVRPLLKPLLDAQRQLSGSATTTASGESRDSDEAELRTAKAQLLARVQNHIASIQTQPDFITIREYRSRFGADSVTLPGEEGYHGAQILAATKACSSLQLIESNIVVV